jgi:hypothetical protein
MVSSKLTGFTHLLRKACGNLHQPERLEARAIGQCAQRAANFPPRINQIDADVQRSVRLTADTGGAEKGAAYDASRCQPLTDERLPRGLDEARIATLEAEPQTFQTPRVTRTTAARHNAFHTTDYFPRGLRAKAARHANESEATA